MSRVIKSADGKTRILVAGTDKAPEMTEEQARELCTTKAPEKSATKAAPTAKKD